MLEVKLQGKKAKGNGLMREKAVIWLSFFAYDEVPWQSIQFRYLLTKDLFP